MIDVKSNMSAFKKELSIELLYYPQLNVHIQVGHILLALAAGVHVNSVVTQA